ncbi:MAG: pantoate--beta-alanine ligase [Rhodospirillales bacterium]|jgi:pantoate--beta-alanine ligase|nr:pantoate--beta-alanine ligase [Rhodospirillales bacterium]
MTTAADIKIVRAVADLRSCVAEWRAAGETVGLVPTMGALHDGHLSLVRMARRECSRVCVTLFVNPKQFNPNEDLAAYPRDEGGDAAKLAAEGAHLLFAPSVEEMYPRGSVTQVAVPGLGDMLEGSFRPGFFTGVATVVAKLLVQALPDVAFFGEKDFQQLLVIKRMAADLDIPVAIKGAPTVREADGLALSSRNAYLTADQRAVAPALIRVLRAVAAAVRNGAEVAAQAEWGRRELLAAGFAKVDYIEVRNALTLQPIASVDEPARVLAAAHLGRARLIDNIPL